MPTWSPEQYLAFTEQRIRPSRDLASHVNIANPARIVDLGCGPGTSTIVCAERWPSASILGVDNSAAMIATARTSHPQLEWLAADIAAWADDTSGVKFDIVFSNAALQWVDSHNELFPKLLRRVNPGGALAVQMPCYKAVPNTLMREVAAGQSWRQWFPEGRGNEWFAYPLEHYYDILAPHTAKLELWNTGYLHILPDTAAIVEWYKGTGLRPYLDVIASESEQERFLAEFHERLTPHYPESPAGGVPFEFSRLFVVAYASGE